MAEHGGGAYYAVIPADVRYDRDLRPNAKLLYGELTSLCCSKGYCWATNEYFAGLYDLSVSTVSRLIGQLEDGGYIRCEMVKTETGSERRIYAGMFVVVPGGSTQKEQDPPRGYAQKEQEGSTQKEQDPTSKNNKYIYTPYNPPTEESKPKRKRQPKMVPQYSPERFEQFWEIYPGGGSRAKAAAAWDALKPDGVLIDQMAKALSLQMKTQQWKDGIGIPHASTWLNQKRWTDKLPPPKNTPPSPLPASPGGWVRDPEVM